MLVEGHIEIEDPLREGEIQVKVESHLIKEDILIEDLLGRGRYPEGGPPTEMEDSLIVEDPLEMEDPLELLVDKDHWVLKDPLDQ